MTPRIIDYQIKNSLGELFKTISKKEQNFDHTNTRVLCAVKFSELFFLLGQFDELLKSFPSSVLPPSLDLRDSLLILLHLPFLCPRHGFGLLKQIPYL